MKKSNLLIITSVILMLFTFFELTAQRNPMKMKKDNPEMLNPVYFETDNPSAVIFDSVSNGYYVTDYGREGEYPYFLPQDDVDSSRWDGKLSFVSNTIDYSYQLPIMFDDPSAMEIVGDTLYVADRYRLFLIDMNADTTIERLYFDSQTEGLTDMAKDSSGYLYISSNYMDSIYRYNISTREINAINLYGDSISNIGSMVFIPEDNSIVIGTYREDSDIYKLYLDSMYLVLIKETDIDYITGIDTDSDGNIFVAQGHQYDQSYSWVTRFDSEFSTDSVVVADGAYNNNIFYNKEEDVLALTVPRYEGVYFLDMTLRKDTVELIYPRDNATNVETDIEFIFHSISDKLVTGYQIIIWADSNYSDRKHWDIIRDTSIIYKNFDTSTTYYWRVWADQYQIRSALSPVWSFTTKGQKLVPSAIFPPDSATDVISNINFSWTASQNAEGYLWEAYYDKYGFDEMMMLTVDSNGVFIPDFDVDSTYYWRVKAIGDSGATGWSKLFRFRTKAATLEEPYHLSPELGIVRLENDVDFSWTAIDGATNYILKVYYPNTWLSFAKVIVDTTAYTVYDLDTNTFYHWTVKAFNSTGTSQWMWPDAYFSTEDSSIVPPKLDPVTPDGKDADVNPLLSWEDTDAIKYKLHLAEIKKEGDEYEPDFIHPVYAKDDIGMNEHKLPVDLKNGTKYAWRVKAEYPNKRRSGWSDASEFETKHIVSVEDDLYNTINLIHPNPANNKIEINSNQFTKAYIYNLLGEELFSVDISGSKSIDVTNLHEGMYVIKLEGKNKVETIRFIIQR